jgi:hypothetical protein
MTVPLKLIPEAPGDKVGFLSYRRDSNGSQWVAMIPSQETQWFLTTN